MKAITVWQPWASLIAEGVKTIETRPKQHPWRSAIGETIAIHAAVREPETMRLGESWWCERTWGSEFGLLDDGGNPRRLPLGAVVATCRLVDVVPMVDGSDIDAEGLNRLAVYASSGALWLMDGHKESTDRQVTDQAPFGDFAPGRWALLLDNVQKTAPMPCRGYQGLWTVPPAVADNLLGLCA